MLRIGLFVMVAVCLISQGAYSATEMAYDGSFEIIGAFLNEGETTPIDGNWNAWGATGDVIYPAGGVVPQPTDGYCYLKHNSGALVSFTHWHQETDVRIAADTKYLLEGDVWLTGDDGGFIQLFSINTTSGVGYFLGQTNFSGLTLNRWNHVTVLWDSATHPEYVGHAMFIPIAYGSTYRYLDNISLKAADICIEETSSITLVREQGATSDTYDIRLYRQPTADVQVAATPTSNRLNLGNGAGVAKIFTFTTANWATPQTVTVTGVDDAMIQTAEAYVPITHSVTSADPYFAELRNVNVCVVDNDGADIQFTGSAVVVSERGPTSGTYGVRLGTLAPTSDVTVQLTYDANQITVSPQVLSFTSGNYTTPQNVTVTAVSNDILEPYAQTVAIKHTSSSSDALYNVLERTFSVTVHDQSCGAWGYRDFDWNHDCYVNMEDFAELAAQWLDCTMPDEPGCTQM